MKYLSPQIFVSLMILISSQSFCQNLVRNCDFDEVTECPDGHGQFDKAVDWRTPTGGTSDLCHSCTSEIVSVPHNMWGSQDAYSGQGYGHIISYYFFVSPQYREYMQTELACPLRAGEEYLVSFFVSCSDNSGFGIDGMGLHFSPDPITQGNTLVIDLGGPPEISHPPGNPIIKKDGWVKISGTYTATGDEKFITIGNYISDENLDIYDFAGNLSNYASYYVSHVSVIPVNSWLDIGNDTITCPGMTISVDASLGCEGQYLWNDGNTSATRILTTPGIYSVDVTVGCGKISDDIRFDWFPVPVIPIPQDTFICSGEAIYLDAGIGFSNYLWQDGSQGNSYLAPAPGLYWVEVEDGNGCLFRDSCNVGPLSEPEVSLGEDLELCSGDSNWLDAGNEGLYSNYTWQDLSTSGQYLVKAPGTYWVKVENPCGSDSDTVHVAYKSCETELWVPNAFTPGLDGQNDVFRAEGVNLGSFHLYIYNRWGQMVFQSDGLSEGWDGTKSGSPCPADVYVWIIFYEGMSGKQENAQVRKGNVMLIR